MLGLSTLPLSPFTSGRARMRWEANQSTLQAMLTELETKSPKISEATGKPTAPTQAAGVEDIPALAAARTYIKGDYCFS